MVAVAGFFGYRTEDNQISFLEQKVDDLRKKIIGCFHPKDQKIIKRFL